MKIDVTTIQGDGFTQITTSHQGQSIDWSARVYSKVKLDDPTRVFLEFNSYLQSIPEVTQDKIFHCYKEARKLFDSGLELEHIGVSLMHHITNMYKNLPLNHMRRWLLTLGNIHIPADLQDFITEDSRYNKRDQTYLKSDYINLATEALAYRAVLPIWAEYMDQCTEHDLYKENDVVALIDNTELTVWPIGETDSMGNEINSVFQKLDDYIKFCVAEEPITLGRIYSGQSTISARVTLQSKVIVRRLAIAPLNDHTSYSMVSNIFRYVKSNVNPTERSNADRVKPKNPEKGAGDDDDNTSFIEAHKTKGRVSPGDIKAYDLDALDYELLAETVDPTICKVKLDKCINRIQVVAHMEIRPHQELLAQWVMAKAFPPRAFYHIDKLSVNYLLATTQALLWHWGFLDAALFMQVEPLKHGNHNTSNQLGQIRIGSRIANKYKPMLDEFYPHMRIQRKPNTGETPKPENRAAIAINSCNHSIRSTHWIYHGPKDLLHEADQAVSHDSVLILPPNLKHSITEAVIHLANINK